ncbi:hypothetical protein BH18ACI4_BH18ACI4_01780 [soil metagenome]
MSCIRMSLALLFCLASMLEPTRCKAQASSKGTISGVIVDAAGAVIPDAHVKATNIATNFSRETTTDSSGIFSILSVDPGTYRVEASAPGFSSSVIQTVGVAVQSIAEVKIELRPGDVTESVLISSEQEVLKTQDTSVSGLVSNQQISLLPTQTRNFADLMRLQPGVQDPQMANPEFGASGAGGFANGQRLDTNTFTLDGSNLNDPGFPGNAISTQRPVPLEAIKEFRVQLASAEAAYGTSSGAQVAMSTKSGGNDLHGSLFYYVRNDVFDARDPLSRRSQASPLKQHQYGFSVSGPVVKDKTFYFGTYEGYNQNRGLVIGGTVPTEALYSQIPNDAAHGFLSSVLRASYRVLPDVFVPGALTGIATFEPTQESRAHTFLVRVDHTITPKDRIYGRYYYTDNKGVSIYLFSPSGTTDFLSLKKNQNFLLNYDRILSPKATNSLRASWYSPFTDFPAFGSRPELNQFGINGDDLDEADGLPFMVFPGTGLTLLGQFLILPFDRPQNIWQVNDDVAWQLGKHEMKMGGQYYRVVIGETISNNLRPQIVFVGLNALRTGTYNSLQQNFPVAPATFRRDYTNTNYAAYISDTFRVNQKLTLNLGLRWDYFGVPSEKNGFLHNVYEADASGNPIADKSPANFRNLTVAQAGDCSGCLNFFKQRFLLFQPRFGLSFKVFEKTVVRAGYSYMYNPFYYEQFNPVRFNSPETISTNLFNQPFGITPSLANISPIQNIYGVDPGLRPSSAQSWNFTVQQEITTNSTFTVAYVGTRSSHLTQLLTPNLGANVPQARRQNQDFAIVDFLTDSGFSNYHALQTEYLQRLSGGFSIQANYTFSKALDNSSIAHTVFGRDRIVPLDSFNPRLDYARSDFDLPHVFRVNFYYDLPIGSHGWKPSNKFLSSLLSNWHLSGITSLQSGHPFSILSGIDSNGDGNVNDRAVFLQGTPNDLIISQGVQYLSPRVPCPAGVTAGAVCTESGVIMHSNYALGAPSGRNIVNGPKFFGVDLTVGRDFKITESTRLQFRAEFYNALNHPNFRSPYPGPNQISSGSFGRSLTTRSNPREIQFALRYEF